MMLRRANARTIILVLCCSVLSSVVTFLMMAPSPRLLKPIKDRFVDPSGHVALEEEGEIPEDTLSQHNPSEVHHLGEGVEAERLFKEVKVLCWILTRPETHEKKARHVKVTWGKRCNKLIFISSQNDTSLGAIDIGVGDGRDVLWGKTKTAYKYVYDHHLQDYDWFFKGDDDTYVIMENMRYMLSAYDPTYPIYFGSRFKKFSRQGYMSGGGGYVLSRAAVKKFVEEALPDDKMCKKADTGAEDAEMGKCMTNIGVLAGDSRDSFGRGRFFPFDPATHLMGGVPNWYLDYVYYKPDTGLDCCSDTPVTFHYIKTSRMYELEYLLYHARPYGIKHYDPFPAPLPLDKNSIPGPILEKQKQKDEAAKAGESAAEPAGLLIAKSPDRDDQQKTEVKQE